MNAILLGLLLSQVHFDVSVDGGEPFTAYVLPLRASGQWTDAGDNVQHIDQFRLWADYSGWHFNPQLFWHHNGFGHWYELLDPQPINSSAISQIFDATDVPQQLRFNDSVWFPHDVLISGQLHDRLKDSVHDVVLTIADVRPGDTDYDADVDFADFAALSNGYGVGWRWHEGDFTGDRRVAFEDFSILSNEFGSVPSVVVPESVTCWVAFLVLFLIWSHYRYAQNRINS